MNFLLSKISLIWSYLLSLWVFRKVISLTFIWQKNSICSNTWVKWRLKFVSWVPLRSFVTPGYSGVRYNVCTTSNFTVSYIKRMCCLNAGMILRPWPYLKQGQYFRAVKFRTCITERKKGGIPIILGFYAVLLSSSRPMIFEFSSEWS